MPSRAVPRAVSGVAASLLAVLLTGCGGSHAVQVTGPTPTLPPGVVPSATVDDLRTKLASIEQDECAREDPARIYPDCGRFVTEVQASLPAVRGQTPRAAGAADAVQAGIAAFSRAGCVSAPNAGAAGSPAACGPALGALQRDVRALVAAVGPAS